MESTTIHSVKRDGTYWIVLEYSSFILHHWWIIRAVPFNANTRPLVRFFARYVCTLLKLLIIQGFHGQDKAQSRLLAQGRCRRGDWRNTLWMMSLHSSEWVWTLCLQSVWRWLRKSGDTLWEKNAWVQVLTFPPLCSGRTCSRSTPMQRWPQFFRKLPNCWEQVLLNDRDPVRWYESVKNTIWQIQQLRNSPPVTFNPLLQVDGLIDVLIEMSVQRWPN